MHPQGGKVDVYKEGKGIYIDIPNERISKLITTEAVNQLYLPHGESEPEKDCIITSRFLAKVSVEALLYWIKDEPFWIGEIMIKTELDDIKRYARYAKGVSLWPYHQRRIYEEADRFLNPDILNEPYEVLHEFNFFWTKENEFYFVIAIMGIEYAINMGGPSIETYVRWLIENNGRSILEWEKEKLVKAVT